MEFFNKKTVRANLMSFTYDPDDENTSIEVTEWECGEGWDIAIRDNPVISISRNELKAINLLTSNLEHEFDKENCKNIINYE